MLTRTLVALALLSALYCATPVYGQSLTGRFTGTVADETGAPLPGVKVTVTNVVTQVVAYSTVSGGQGVYLVPSVPPGVYNLSFEARGFKKAEVRNVTLQVDQRAQVDARLSPGEITETVNVTGETLGQLERESSSIDEVINTSQVKGLPLPNRDVLNLLTLVGGVSSGGAATGINTSQLSINGSRTANTEITVDGMSVIEGAVGRLSRMPSTEAIRELRVLTSAYSAEYGRTSGGFINAVVESGTREYHGGLYEYFRNEKLNANDFFNNARGVARPRDRFNQFGGKLGGPLRLPRFGEGGPALTRGERTFFFFNYEGLRRQLPAAPILTIPDERFRAGDFSASPIIVRDPLTGQPFPGNRIPQGRIDPAARRIMGLLPAPNSEGVFNAANGFRTNNYVNTQSAVVNNNDFTTRIDHSAFNDRARMFGRFTAFRGLSAGVIEVPGLLNAGVGDINSTAYQIALGYTHTLSPSLVLEANAGYARNQPNVDPPGAGIDVRNVLGIQRSTGNATPRFLIAGFSGLGSNTNTLRREITNTYQTSAALSYVRGAQLLKFGFQLRKNQFNTFNPGGNYFGIYNFNGEITAPNSAAGNPVHALADFLLGQVQSAQYSLAQPLTGRRNYNFGLFVQDDYKITKRLTLNFGLRYEYESPVTEVNNVYSRVAPETGRLLAAGVNASSALDLKADKMNFAPRIGFAYSLNDKTVVRSAFGIFYSQVFSNLGGVVRFPGYTVVRDFLDLGVAVAQPFTLSQGHPLDAVQNLKDPLLIERQASVTNPLLTSDQFVNISPLPSTMQWNFGVQRQLPGDIVVDASYVGSRGLHLPLLLFFNQAPFERTEELARLGSAVETQRARPYPTVGDIRAFVHAGTSTYHSLQLKGQRQFSRSLSFLASYTFAKSIDDGSGIFNFSQPNGLDSGQFPRLFRNLDCAVSAFDRPHNFTLALQYTTPGPRFLRGFQINPILIARSGLPDTITQTNLNPIATQQRPSVANGNSLYAPSRTSEGTGIRYLLAPTDPNFPLTPSGPLFVGTGATRRLVLPVSIGTLGRNTIREPGEFNIDLSVSRRIPITEKVGFQLRAEAFNLLNHTNFNAPASGLNVTANAAGNAVFNSPGFGLITSAKAARFMQLVARFEF